MNSQNIIIPFNKLKYPEIMQVTGQDQIHKITQRIMSDKEFKDYQNFKNIQDNLNA